MKLCQRSPLLSRDKEPTSYDTRKGHATLLCETWMAASFTLISRHWRTPDRTSDTLLRRTATRARCITRPEENTDNNPSESANCNLRWPPRLSRGIFTPRKEIFLPYPFSRHGTAISPFFIPCNHLEPPSRSRRIVCWFRIQMSRRPSLRCCRPPVDSDKPV